MLVFLKLGGSLITDKTKPYTAREEIIRRIAKEIKEVLEKRKDLQILIGHGSGSFGHYPAKEYRVKEGIINEKSWRGYALTRAAASKLNQILVEIFLEEGLNAVSLQPSSSAIVENGKLTYLNLKPIEFLLEKGQIPVIYGDAVLDLKKGIAICSTEDLFFYMAPRLKPKKIYLVGIAEGVFDRDPIKFPNAKLIEKIDQSNIEEVKHILGESHGIDVTGGMLTKVLKMYELAKKLKDIEIYILSGEKEGNVKEALLGKQVGTLISYAGLKQKDKILILDINGVILPSEKRPWLLFLERLKEEGILDKEIFEKEIKPIAEKYLERKISRDDAVKIITHIYANALRGKDYSSILSIAKEVSEELESCYNKEILNLIEKSKKKGYLIVLITGNFWEIAKFIKEKVNADLLLAVKLKVNKENIVTGKLEGPLLTSAGKNKSVKNLLAYYGIPKHKVVYIGDDIGDWKPIKESVGMGILYNPNLDNDKELPPEIEEWIEEVKEFIRRPENSHVIIIHEKYANHKLEEITL